ncbi:MAG: peptidylprolyl isomerase FKBP-type [Parcubacteria group bacterium]|nr:peptidylprolyl isomerase FKBP-type [Parcubacteria group bacterium]
MNVTGTGIAVAIALVIAVAFLFFGPAVFTPFSSPTPAESGVVDITASSTNATSTAMQYDPSQPLPTELTITDEVVGTGAEVKAGDTVSVNYVGMLPDGTVFDASAKHGGAASFPIGVGRVIKGWDAGIVGMKVGGKRQLIVPGDLAYGPNGYPEAGIPANATLIFDVELVGIQ